LNGRPENGVERDVTEAMTMVCRVIPYAVAKR